MDSYPAEITMPYVMYFQLAILGYFVLVMIHFCVFAAKKPKIEHSLRAQKCLSCKYIGCWLILVFFMLAMQVSTFYMAYTISSYNTRWIEVL